MRLYNIYDRKVLRENLNNENFKRVTISFYRYFILESPKVFRDEIYAIWSELECFGRIYIAKEGINSQMSVPEHKMELFMESLSNYPIFENIPIKYAIEDDGKSFFKLAIKVRDKLVADGLSDDCYDVTNVGKHIDALEFHKLVSSGEHIVVDMRNHYESEIGHFKGAICPDAETFRDELILVNNLLADKKEKKILLYCTGGIRCEKASAYLKHNGYSDVNQLYGGIIEYARQIKVNNLDSAFIGKNFVFDDRLGESVNGQVIANCHQCGTVCDTHTNCANQLCHLLFIQCNNCKEKYHACCSSECSAIKNAPEEIKYIFRNQRIKKFNKGRYFKKIS